MDTQFRLGENLKIKIIYSDLTEEVLDSREFKIKARDDILVLWAYTNPPIKLEKIDGYIVFNMDGHAYFGGLGKSQLLRDDNTLHDFTLEELLTFPMHFGKEVNNEIFVKASEVRP